MSTFPYSRNGTRNRLMKTLTQDVLCLEMLCCMKALSKKKKKSFCVLPQQGSTLYRNNFTRRVGLAKQDSSSVTMREREVLKLFTLEVSWIFHWEWSPLPVSLFWRYHAAHACCPYHRPWGFLKSEGRHVFLLFFLTCATIFVRAVRTKARDVVRSAQLKCWLVTIEELIKREHVEETKTYNRPA